MTTKSQRIESLSGLFWVRQYVLYKHVQHEWYYFYIAERIFKHIDNGRLAVFWYGDYINSVGLCKSYYMSLARPTLHTTINKAPTFDASLFCLPHLHSLNLFDDLFIKTTRCPKGISLKRSYGSVNHDIECMHTHRRYYFDYLLLNL